jgi:hypothetical protein
MSDGAYSLWMAFSSLALIAVLWLRFRQGRILKKLLRSLSQEQREQLGLSPPAKEEHRGGDGEQRDGFRDDAPRQD